MNIEPQTALKHNHSDAFKEILGKLSTIKPTSMLFQSCILNKFHHLPKIKKYGKSAKFVKNPYASTMYNYPIIKNLNSLIMKIGYQRTFSKKVLLPRSRIENLSLTSKRPSESYTTREMKFLADFVFESTKIRQISFDLKNIWRYHDLEYMIKAIQNLSEIKEVKLLKFQTGVHIEKSIFNLLKRLRRTKIIKIYTTDLNILKERENFSFVLTHQNVTFNNISNIVSLFTNLKELSLKFSPFTNHNDQKNFWKSLRKFQQLEILNLDLTSLVHQESKEIEEEFNYNLPKLRKVFLTYNAFENSHFHSFMQALKKSALEIIKMNITTNYNDTTFLLDLNQAIRTNLKLKSIDLEFKNKDGISEDQMKEFCTNLLESSSITDINFRFYNLSPIGAPTISNSLPQTQGYKLFMVKMELFYASTITLKDNSFSIIKGNDINNEVLLISDIFKIHPFIETVHIEYSDYQKENFDLKAINLLSKSLNSLQNLKKLKLSFENSTTISDLFASELLDLTSLFKLEHLILNFNFVPKIANRMAQSLSYSLPFMINLTKLELYFLECTGLTSEGVYQVFNGLENHTKLFELTLEFYWIPLIDDSPIVELAKILKNMPELNKLVLKFGANISSSTPSLVTKSSIKKLIESFQFLRQLEKFNFSFPWVECIDDITLAEFGLSLNNLIKVKNLSIYLTGCKCITPKGLNLLGKGLNGLLLLEEFYLIIGSNDHLDKETVKNLISMLLYNENIREVMLNFQNCPKLSNSDWKKECALDGFYELLTPEGILNLTKEKK